MKRLGVLLLAIAVLGGTGWGWSEYSARVDGATDRRSDVTASSSQAPETRVAFVGDSYTAGAGVAASEAFPALLAGDLGWAYANLAEGGTGYITRPGQEPEQSRLGCGEDYCPSYAEVIPDLVQYEPDIVIVSGGRNSANDPASAQEKAIESFFEDLREALSDADIYATTPLTDDDAATGSLVAMGGLVEEAVTRVGGTYLEIGQPLEGAPQLVLDDGVHPNGRGHEVIADAILAALG